MIRALLSIVLVRMVGTTSAKTVVAKAAKPKVGKPGYVSFGPMTLRPAPLTACRVWYAGQYGLEGYDQVPHGRELERWRLNPLIAAYSRPVFYDGPLRRSEPLKSKSAECYFSALQGATVEKIKFWMLSSMLTFPIYLHKMRHVNDVWKAHHMDATVGIIHTSMIRDVINLTLEPGDPEWDDKDVHNIRKCLIAGPSNIVGCNDEVTSLLTENVWWLNQVTRNDLQSVNFFFKVAEHRHYIVKSINKEWCLYTDEITGQPLFKYGTVVKSFIPAAPDVVDAHIANVRLAIDNPDRATEMVEILPSAVPVTVDNVDNTAYEEAVREIDSVDVTPDASTGASANIVFERIEPTDEVCGNEVPDTEADVMVYEVDTEGAKKVSYYLRPRVKLSAQVRNAAFGMQQSNLEEHLDEDGSKVNEPHVEYSEFQLVLVNFEDFPLWPCVISGKFVEDGNTYYKVIGFRDTKIRTVHAECILPYDRKTAINSVREHKVITTKVTARGALKAAEYYVSLMTDKARKTYVDNKLLLKKAKHTVNQAVAAKRKRGRPKKESSDPQDPPRKKKK